MYALDAGNEIPRQEMTDTSHIIIATRGSKLALAQANWVGDRLSQLDPTLQVELSILKTKGDKILDVPLAKVGGKGLFVKEIEDALLSGAAQVAVHSMKDMPAELPQDLIISAVPRREDPRDLFIGLEGMAFDDLPQGARVGTSALRRQAQLLARRPDLEMVPIRGNVDTRLAKLGTDGIMGVVLASAGIRRLGLDIKAQLLEPEIVLPAVGQGALGIETRADNDFVNRLTAQLNHAPTAQAVECERAFLARLEGGCQVPIAGHATIEQGYLHFSGLVAGLSGSPIIRKSGSANASQAARLGLEVADEVLNHGGKEILDQLYSQEAL